MTVLLYLQALSPQSLASCCLVRWGPLNRLLLLPK